jgi:nucleoside-diphosphate-sugar epimerase
LLFSYVGGPPLVLPPKPEQLNETVVYVWHVLSGKPLSESGIPEAYYSCVDVRDVARLVVFGIENPEKTNNERFIAANGFAPLQAAADILRAAYPERRHIIDEGNPGEGYTPDFKYPEAAILDGSKAVKATGQNWIPLQSTILDAAKAFEIYL